MLVAAVLAPCSSSTLHSLIQPRVRPAEDRVSVGGDTEAQTDGDVVHHGASVDDATGRGTSTTIEAAPPDEVHGDRGG